MCQSPKTFCIIAVFSLLTGMFWVADGSVGHTLLAQDASEFHVYHLSRTTPTEARRMLAELLGTEADHVRIVADVENSDLMVSGSPAVQKLTKQLVEQINAANAESPAAKTDLVVKTYVCDPAVFDLRLKSIRNAISASGRVSADRSRRQIVVAAPAADHKIAAEVLAASMPEPAMLFATSNDWAATDKNADPGSPVMAQGRRASPQKSLPGKTNSRQPRFPSFDGDSNAAEVSVYDSDRDASTKHFLAFQFRNISIEQAEAGVQRLLGHRVQELEAHRFNFSVGRTRQVTMLFDVDTNSCKLEGSQDLVLQFATLLQQFEDARDKNAAVTIRFVPLTNVDPDVLNRALILWKQSLRREQTADAQSNATQGSKRQRDNTIRLATFQQIPGKPAIPIEPGGQMPADDSNPSTDPPQDNQLRRPSSDVTV
ncbi:MAG: hypothetical protein O2856_10990, partial [Planctomycetota bacterium]|nr:hypothetical protein [Planctomycetota bacterium]